MKARKLSKVGRTRKAGPRKPCGRLVQEKGEPVSNVVLMQPHRKGSTDQNRITAIGRLILDGKVKHSRLEPADLLRAAESYSKAYANVRWIWNSRRPYAVATGHGGEPSAAEAEVFKEAWRRVQLALRQHGERITKAAQFAILDDPQDERVLAPWIILSLPTALGAIAEHYGLTSTGSRNSVRNISGQVAP